MIFDLAGVRRRQELEGHAIAALAPAAWTRLWAAVDGQEIWRREKAGSDWMRIATLDGGLDAQCMADTRANAEDGILIGTSQARLVRVEDGRPEPVPSFDQAPGRERWYTPWGGPPAVRSITEDRQAVLVNVHVGGVLRTLDRGQTWAPTIDVHADVHRVVTGAGRIYAAGAEGLSVSSDEGDSWTLSSRGLHGSYCRSVAVCGETILLSASDGPGGGRAALYRSDLEARTFERCRAGLPEWFEGNLDSLCLDALPDGSQSAFGSESGDVFASSDHGATWTRLAEHLPAIRCVLVMP